MVELELVCEKCQENFNPGSGCQSEANDIKRRCDAFGINVPKRLCNSCLLSYKRLADEKQQEIPQAKLPAENK